MSNIIVISGPTCVGKSSLSVELAKKINAEIVSVDVYQSYKDMNIGTAKVTLEEMQGVKHYMIDEYSPSENIDVARFVIDAQNYIKQIFKKGKNVVLVGGSGLYIDSIIYDSYEFIPNADTKDYTNELYDLLEKKGKEYIFELLVRLDPEYATKTHMNNIKRVIGAINYYYVNNKRKSEVSNRALKSSRYENVSYYTLKMDRDVLYKRINKRVDIMFEAGLLNEVRGVAKKYNVDQKYNSMQAIGYKEVLDMDLGVMTKSECCELIKKKSRNYAKRQLTWFRSNNDVVWIEVDKNSTDEIIDRICEQINEDQ